MNQRSPPLHVKYNRREVSASKFQCKECLQNTCISRHHSAFDYLFCHSVLIQSSRYSRVLILGVWPKFPMYNIPKIVQWMVVCQRLNRDIEVSLYCYKPRNQTTMRSQPWNCHLDSELSHRTITMRERWNRFTYPFYGWVVYLIHVRSLATSPLLNLQAPSQVQRQTNTQMVSQIGTYCQGAPTSGPPNLFQLPKHSTITARTACTFNILSVVQIQMQPPFSSSAYRTVANAAIPSRHLPDSLLPDPQCSCGYYWQPSLSGIHPRVLELKLRLSEALTPSFDLQCQSSANLKPTSVEICRITLEFHTKGPSTRVHGARGLWLYSIGMFLEQSALFDDIDIRPTKFFLR